MRFPRSFAAAGAVFLGLVTLAPGALAQSGTYRFDFESGRAPGFNPAPIESAPRGGKLLGRFAGNDETRLTLRNLRPHRSVTLRLDLYIIHSWDGNGKDGYGPDELVFTADGKPFLKATFANSTSEQSFSDRTPLGGGPFPARKDSDGSGLRGYPDHYGSDTLYRLAFTIRHQGPTLVLNFGGKGLQGIGDESWAIDDLLVQFDSGTAAPPPPAPDELQVKSVKIEYAGWQSRRSALQTDADRALREAEASLKAWEARKEELRRDFADLQRLADVERERRDALVAARNAEPAPPNDPAYRRLTDSVARAERRMAVIMQRLPQAHPSAKGALVDEHRQLEKSVSRYKTQLAGLDHELGVDDERARLRAAADAADQAHLQALKAHRRALSDLNASAAGSEALRDSYLEACKRYDVAVQALSFMGAESPFITPVRSRNFQANAWSPEADIRHLEAQIREVRGHILTLDRRRTELRRELVTRFDETTAAADSARNAAIGSYGLQFLVEAGFTAAELIRIKDGKVVKNPYILFGDSVRKIVENIIWPPTYLDAQDLTGPDRGSSPLLLAMAPSPEPTVEKRLWKSFATGPTTNLVVSGYLAKQSREELAAIGRRMIRRSWMDGEQEFLRPVQLNFEVRPLLAEQTARMREAQQNLVKATSARGIVENGLKSSLWGLVKDGTKTEVKQAIANWMEGEALTRYLDAQIALSATSTQLLRVSNYYWQARDLEYFLTTMHRSIVAEWDPGTGMRVTRTGRIPQDQDLQIELSNRGSDPHHPSALDVEVQFGPLTAERLSGGRLIFRITSAQLRTLRPDTYPLVVRVNG